MIMDIFSHTDIHDGIRGYANPAMPCKSVNNKKPNCRSYNRITIPFHPKIICPSNAGGNSRPVSSVNFMYPQELNAHDCSPYKQSGKNNAKLANLRQNLSVISG